MTIYQFDREKLPEKPHDQLRWRRIFMGSAYLSVSTCIRVTSLTPSSNNAAFT